VNGVDSSATSSFLKIRQLAEDHDFVIVISSAEARVERNLEKAEFLVGEDERIKIFPDLDRGLEWCEDRLLERFISKEDFKEKPLFDSLIESYQDHGAISTLLTYLEPQQFKTSEVLIQQGSPSNDMYFVESGRVSIQLELPDKSHIRLRSMGAGTIVGEMALYLRQPRTASVVAEEHSRVYRITQQSLTRMKQDDPSVYAIFCEIMIRLLANRLVESNKIVSALMS
jgi:SulP family sulfate permease